MDGNDRMIVNSISPNSSTSILPLSPSIPTTTRRLSDTNERVTVTVKGKEADRSLMMESSSKGKGVDRSKALIGFDDTEELIDEEGASDHLRGNILLGDNEEDPHCAICLSPIENKASISPCQHSEFCFLCIRAWTDQSRRCPLCLGVISHLEYNRRSSKDYQIHHLLPLPSMPSSDGYLFAPPLASPLTRLAPLPARHTLYGRDNSISIEDDATWREKAEEKAIERRAYIYREKLFAKHIASNIYTKFKPFTPQSFSSNSELKARVIKFVRRELQVFPSVDVVFLTTYVISIASQLDLRSASAIRLLSDFLNEDDAEHFSHEVCTFARSSFSSLEAFDRNVQYPRPERADEAIVNAVNGGRIESTKSRNGNGNGNGTFNRRPIDRSLLNENNRYANRPNDRNGGGRGGRGGGRQSNQDDYFRSSDGRRNEGRFSNQNNDRYAQGANNSPNRRYSRSTSSSRNGRRASRRSISRGRDRSRSYSRSYSRSRSRSRSYSPSHSRSRSRSRYYTPTSRSKSDSPRRSRSPTSTHDDRLSLPDQPFTNDASTSLSTSNYSYIKHLATNGRSFSVFGAARRLAGPIVDLSKIIQEPLSQTKSLPSVQLLGRISTLATSSAASNVDPNSSSSTPSRQDLPLLDESESNHTELPLSDLKTKLQERLMAEYRTDLANKATSSSPKPKGDVLRLILQERLKSEKALSDSTLRERVVASRKRHLQDVEGSSHQPTTEREREEDYRSTTTTTTTIWNSDIRNLLLARLEEENSRSLGIEIGMEGSVSMSESTSDEGIMKGKEEALRLALSQRRKSPAVVEEAPIEDRAVELRRKLKQRRISAV